MVVVVQRMSVSTFSLDLTVEKSFIRDVLCGLLNTIIFHRTFINIRPVELQLLDYTVCSIEDPELERTLQERIQTFISYVEANASPKAQIAVMFFEKKTQRAWYGQSSKEICWEQWLITLTFQNVRTERESIQARLSSKDQFGKTLLQIIDVCDAKKDHIPAITSTDTNPFPYQITMPAVNDSWGSMLKRMLSDAPPILS